MQLQRKKGEQQMGTNLIKLRTMQSSRGVGILVTTVMLWHWNAQPHLYSGGACSTDWLMDSGLNYLDRSKGIEHGD
jgi:hypothetical protein